MPQKLLCVLTFEAGADTLGTYTGAPVKERETRGMGTPARVTTTQTFAIGPGGCSSQDPRASLCGRDCTACWQLEFLAESKFQLLPPQKHGNCEMPSAAGLGIVSPRDCTSHKAHRERYAVFFLKTRETWIDRLITEQKREARFGRCRRARHGVRGWEGGPCPADSAAVGGPRKPFPGTVFSGNV